MKHAMKGGVRHTAEESRVHRGREEEEEVEEEIHEEEEALASFCSLSIHGHGCDTA